VSSEDWLGLPGSVLVDLYLRLRDEVDDNRQTLDPNDKVRAPIAMALLALSQVQTANLAEIECRVRRLIALAEERPESMHQLAQPLFQSLADTAAALPPMRHVSRALVIASGSTGPSPQPGAA
jgi:hypothetical protein